MKRRSYRQMCGLAGALDTIGERWTLLLIRELLGGPKRFRQLQTILRGMGPNLLADRLHSLQAAGLVAADEVSVDRRGREYRLTSAGAELRPAVLEMARWGLRHGALTAEADAVASSGWARLAVEALILDTPPVDVPEDYQFVIDEEQFVLHASDDGCSVSDGVATEPSARIATDAGTFMRIGSGLLDPIGAIGTGLVRVDGSLEAVDRCARLLGLGQETAR